MVVWQVEGFSASSPKHALCAGQQRSLRVLFDITKGSQEWGGIEEHVCMLGRRLAAAGCEPLFLRRADFPADKLERLAAAHIRVLEIPEVVAQDGRHPPLLTWMRAYRTAISCEQVDVVHMHSSLHGNEVWAATAARLAGVGTIVCTYHCLPGVESRRRRLAMSAMHRLLSVHGITVSTAVHEGIRKHYLMPPGYLTQITNGVDDPGLPVPGPGWQPGSPMTVAVISRLSPEKGIDVFVRALALLAPTAQVSAVVVGDGDELEPLKQQARELGVEAWMAFVGYAADAVRLLPTFDLVVIPSRTEGLSLVAVEACAAGRPIIASAIGGLLELVHDGENGWLVPVEDEKALAKAIEQASNNRQLLRRMGAAGRRRYESHLRSDVMARNVLRVYHSTLARRHANPLRSPIAPDIQSGGNPL